VPPHNTAAAGRAATGGGMIGSGVQLGDEKYLWLLVILEVVAIGMLRQAFKRHHGG
jgi:hypothetical protein